MFDFGDIQNSASTAQTITIVYEVQADNVLNNQDSVNLDNSVELSYDNASQPLPSASDSVQIIEPNISIAKIITAGAAGSDAGDVISYKIDVSNSSPAATAFRVNLKDIMPAELLGGTPTFANVV